MQRAYVPALPPRSLAGPSTPSAFLLACHTRPVSFRAKSLPALGAKNIWVVTAEDLLSVARLDIGFCFPVIEAASRRSRGMSFRLDAFRQSYCLRGERRSPSYGSVISL